MTQYTFFEVEIAKYATWYGAHSSGNCMIDVNPYNMYFSSYVHKHAIS